MTPDQQYTAVVLIDVFAIVRLVRAMAEGSCRLGGHKARPLDLKIMVRPERCRCRRELLQPGFGDFKTALDLLGHLGGVPSVARPRRRAEHRG
jgi:hypothetical protein